MKTVNDLIRNITIEHSHYLESYKNSEILKVIKLMNETDRDLARRLLNYPSNSITRKRLKLMKNDVDDIMKEAEAILKEKVRGTAKDFGAYEGQWAYDTLIATIPKEIGLILIQPSAEQIYSAINAFSFTNTTMTELFSGWANKKRKLFKGALQQGYLQGQTGDQIVRRLFGTKRFKYTDGLVNTSRRELRTSVRTTINHMSNVAREEVYRRNSSVIKGVQWLSTLDGATSLICINLDGKVDLYDKTVMQLNGLRPPAHYGCRSTTIPIVKSLKEMGLFDKDYSVGTRASMNGQVSGSITYPKWFKDQSAKFQKSVLGVSRYKLYKDGKFKLSKFVANNQRLTLKQLKIQK